MIIRNFVPMLWQCWMGFIEVESQPVFLQQVNKMAKVLWIPLKSLKLCKSPLDLLEANQYDINKEESKLNEDERFEKWIFFFCGGFFFLWNTCPCWLGNRLCVNSLVIKWNGNCLRVLNEILLFFVKLSFLNVGFNQVVKMLIQLKFGNLILSLMRCFKYPLPSQQILIKISMGVSFPKLLSLLLN